jgi:hypothetical protein
LITSKAEVLLFKVFQETLDRGNVVATFIIIDPSTGQALKAEVERRFSGK